LPHLPVPARAEALDELIAGDRLGADLGGKRGGIQVVLEFFRRGHNGHPPPKGSSPFKFVTVDGCGSSERGSKETASPLGRGLRRALARMPTCRMRPPVPARGQ